MKSGFRANKKLKSCSTSAVMKYQGLILLILVLLPVKIFRAPKQNSFWIDEFYSVQIANRSVSDIISLTAMDAHPPFYYFLLRLWIVGGEKMGLGQSLLWARLLNVFLWILFSGFVWFASRSLLGKFNGALISWMVLSSAQIAYCAKDIRGYALSTFSVFTSFLILFHLWRRSRLKSKTGINSSFIKLTPDIILWSCYSIGSVMALYTHLLSIFILMNTCLIWIILSMTKGQKSKSFLWGGILAHVLTILIFLPWLLHLRSQINHLQKGALLWMTPRTLWNLIRVFILWYPYGRILITPADFGLAYYFLGALSVILPISAALQALKFPRQGKRDSRMIAIFGLACMGMAFVFALTLFVLHRFTGLQVFHGPRYPSLATPFWMAGLTSLSIWSAGRMKRSRLFAMLLILPLVFCNIMGQWISGWGESSGGIKQWKEIAKGFFPKPGGEIYMIPSTLIPYFQTGLKEFNVKPIEDISSIPLSQRDVYILDASVWVQLQSFQDKIILDRIQRGELSASTDILDKPGNMLGFRSYRLYDFKHEKAGGLFQE